MVLAVSEHNMNAKIPSIFRSYQAPKNQMADCAIWEALRATSAHPDLFKSIEIGQPNMRESFVDGGLGCNNPLAHILAEAKLAFPDRNVACIISIGTGHGGTIHIPKPNLFWRVLPSNATATMKSLATDCEQVAQEMAARFHDTKDIYFRLNVDQGMQNIDISDWGCLGEANAHTRAYMHHMQADQSLDSSATALRIRKGAVSTSQIGKNTY